MRKIRIIWVGRSKEPFVRDAISKYERLIRPYARIELRELKEGRGRDPRAVIREESERILKETRRFFLLDGAGREMGSEVFARWLEKETERAEPLDLVIGGAFGVDDKVRENARRRISLSRMTLTHQIVRIVLLEQLFRAFTILTGRTYHY